MKNIADALKQFCGNGDAKRALSQLVATGRMPHALCILGETGTGKKTFAQIAAAAAVCESDAPADRPCGHCPHCVKAAGQFHPDISMTGGGGGVRSFHIDAIRDIRKAAYLKPNEARCKVYILADAHEMTDQAQNALLKLIEEPPDNTMLILTCHSSQALLPTILSRVAVIRLAAPDVTACAAFLAQGYPQYSQSECAGAAQSANGNIGKALGFLSDEDAAAAYQLAQDIYAAFGRGDEFEALCLFAQAENDRDGYINLLYRLREMAVRDASQSVQGTPGILAPHKAVRAAEQFLASAARAGQNVSLSLVSAGLTGSVMEVI